MDAKGPIIRANGLTRIYTLGESEVVGLGGINLTISPGEIVVLKGNSGSGKSTLLSLLGGLDRPTRGDLWVGGVDLVNTPPRTLTRFRRQVVGMVFQSFNLLPTLSVIENVCLPAHLAGHAADRTRARARGLLEDLQLGARLHHRPYQLSGGEMQRTAIARALINNPLIILADEPTGNLDTRNGQIVIEVLARLTRSKGHTLVIATHSALADAWASRQICLKDGIITEEICDT